jgi:biotin carboxyl carrier protein
VENRRAEGFVAMKYSVWINDQKHTVEIVQSNGQRIISWNGVPVQVDGEITRESSRVILIDGRSYEVNLEDDGHTTVVQVGQSRFGVRVDRHSAGQEGEKGSESGSQQEIVTSPMPGMVVTVKVEPGQAVKRGDPLLILEAMKMENQLRSPVDARIETIAVDQGQKVERGEKLIILGV